MTKTIRIGGEGGEGVISAGEVISLAAARCGWQIFSMRTYPAEIKGGLAIYQMRISSQPIGNHGDELDIAFCLTKEAWEASWQELSAGGTAVYDPSEFEPEAGEWNTVAIPFTTIAKSEFTTSVVKSAIVVGVLGELLKLPLDVVEATFAHKFGGKKAALLPLNRQAIQRGYALANDIGLSVAPNGKPVPESRQLLSGNQAMALGALAGGVQYVAGYPITPATPILEFLAREIPRFNGNFVQTEDEISALASCLGAGFAGSRALTATSGPGFALMSELMNLGVMAEVPVVIVNVQRAGPSTGMPTKTEQSDLLFALWGSPGDSSRPVLAPANVQESYELMQEAMEVASELQCPVIVLSDQSLGYRLETVALHPISSRKSTRETTLDTQDYRRYLETESGVSPVVEPGGDAPLFIAGGLEHDEFGQPDYSGANHIRMMAKRARKINLITLRDSWKVGLEQLGQDSGIAILSWGSTLGAIREATAKLELELDESIGHFHLRWLNPFPTEELSNWVEQHHFRNVIFVEENHSGQLELLVRARTGITGNSVRKAAGVPFTPGEIVSGIKHHLGVPTRVDQTISL